MGFTERLKAIRPFQCDWRGWIALAWALWWGAAYAVMVWQARAPQVAGVDRMAQVRTVTGRSAHNLRSRRERANTAMPRREVQCGLGDFDRSPLCRSTSSSTTLPSSVQAL